MVSLLFGNKTLKTRRSIVVIGTIVFLILGAVAFFLAQANKQDVFALNQKLPAGITVVKNVFGEYLIVNQKDGYSFKIPREWKGIESIEYLPGRAEKEYFGSSMTIIGKEGVPNLLSIDRFNNDEPDKSLIKWAEDEFKAFELVGEFTEDKIGKIDVVKTKEEKHLMGMSVYYFKKNNQVYALTGGSEEYLKYIITNGKW
ncbi:MAG: hypothetical protein V1905_00075 [bacterium]